MVLSIDSIALRHYSFAFGHISLFSKLFCSILFHSTLSTNETFLSIFSLWTCLVVFNYSSSHTNLFIGYVSSSSTVMSCSTNRYLSHRCCTICIRYSSMFLSGSIGFFRARSSFISFLHLSSNDLSNTWRLLGLWRVHVSNKSTNKTRFNFLCRLNDFNDCLWFSDCAIFSKESSQQTSSTLGKIFLIFIFKNKNKTV